MGTSEKGGASVPGHCEGSGDASGPSPAGSDWPSPIGFDRREAVELFCRGVEDLEDARRGGWLDAVLLDPAMRVAVGPRVHAVYEKFVRSESCTADHPRHAATIATLIQQLRRRLSPGGVSYRAALVGDDAAQDPAAARFRVAGHDGLELRFDQVASALDWGVGFSFADPRVQSRVDAWLTATVAGEFATTVSDLHRLLRRIGPQYPALLPPDRSHEWLMRDILNEHRAAAKLTSLEADYSQKTDLRYLTERPLFRSRGARVQITALADRRMYESKLAAIPNREVVVILSPIALADWLEEETANSGHFPEPLDDEAIKRVWSALGQPMDTEECVEAISSALRQARARGLEHPLGPLHAVPTALRQLIRSWVDRSAYRTTRLLRAHESVFGRQKRRADGRMQVWYRGSPVTDRAAWQAHVERYRPGEALAVTVLSRKRGALWAERDGVRVFVVDDRRPHAVAGDRLEVVLLDHCAASRWSTAVPPEGVTSGGLLSVVPCGGRAARFAQRAAVLATAPWLTAGLVLDGVVKKRTDYGVFVEILPGYCALLPRAELAGARFDAAPDETVRVRVLSVDRSTQRVRLALTDEPPPRG